MERQGYELWLAKDRNGWRSTFLHRRHVMQPWVGQVLYWCPTPWRAVQEAAWRALSTPFARDYFRHRRVADVGGPSPGGGAHAVTLSLLPISVLRRRGVLQPDDTGVCRSEERRVGEEGRSRW